MIFDLLFDFKIFEKKKEKLRVRKIRNRIILSSARVVLIMKIWMMRLRKIYGNRNRCRKMIEIIKEKVLMISRVWRVRWWRQRRSIIRR
jgi:hypothetical protein